MMARIAKYLSTTKRKILMKTFFESLFNYCPLIWMFCGRSLNNKINVLHERALRIAYNDYTSSFETLLENDFSVTIHQKNLRCLATEMFKIKNKLAPPFICDLIQESTSRYNTRSHTIVTECENGQTNEDKNIMSVPKVNKVKTGIETFSFIGPKIWNSLSEELKNTKSLVSFKSKLKDWKFTNCPCSICRTYIAGVGYID